jgi:hypothetical protein
MESDDLNSGVEKLRMRRKWRCIQCCMNLFRSGDMMVNNIADLGMANGKVVMGM